MTVLQPPGEARTMRARLRAKLVAKVRYWIDGHQMVYVDGPHRRVRLSEPTWAPMKILAVEEWDGEPIQVGRYSGVHYSTVMIPGGAHHPEWVGILHALVEDGDWTPAEGAIGSKGPIVVGSDVMTGYGSTIMSGVTIGDGAIVAPCAVVTKSVEPYSIVGGNPAKHIRYRFDEHVREALLRIKWWDWPVEKVARHRAHIHSPDVLDFVSQHDPQLENRASCGDCR